MMMYATIKAMPGLERRVPEYRILFSAQPGERPIDTRVLGLEQLRDFLADKLEQPTATVDRVISELEASHHGPTSCIRNLPFDVAELRAIARELQAEQRQNNPTPVG